MLSGRARRFARKTPILHAGCDPIGRPCASGLKTTHPARRMRVFRTRSRRSTASRPFCTQDGRLSANRSPPPSFRIIRHAECGHFRRRWALVQTQSHPARRMRCSRVGTPRHRLLAARTRGSSPPRAACGTALPTPAPQAGAEPPVEPQCSSRSAGTAPDSSARTPSDGPLARPVGRARCRAPRAEPPVSSWSCPHGPRTRPPPRPRAAASSCPARRTLHSRAGRSSRTASAGSSREEPAARTLRDTPPRPAG